MKKLLPTSTTLSVNKFKGFTLVELLVVISIIAILSTIGIVVFTGVTGRARDSKRIQDIDSIANAMEAHFANGAYVALSTAFFQNSVVPADPLNGVSNCGGNLCTYCVEAAPLTARFTTCTTAVGDTQPPAGSSFTVCANLEGNNGPGGHNYYCRSNSQ